MKQTLDAVYENGVFKPSLPPNLPDGQHVRLEIETPSEENPEDLLELASQVYDELSNSQIEEIEQIALDRRDFFRNRAD
jgi:predicted DNA-binding antitoxin AbrB/MazE fold protein